MNWNFSLVDANSTRRGTRPMTPQKVAAELVGFDGNSEGGLRPFPGFKYLWTLAPFTDRDPGETYGDVKWAQGFELRTIDNVQIWGLVYRVNGTGSGDDHIFLEYRIGSNPTVYVEELLWPVDPTLAVDATTYQFLLYVSIQGRPPVRVRFSATGGSPAYAPEILGGTGSGTYTGPGLEPILVSPDRSSTLGSYSATGDANRPGAGQVKLLSNAPSTQDPLWVGSGSSSDSESGSFGTYPTSDEETRPLQPGKYSFVYQLYDSRTGLKSAISQVAQANESDFNTAVDDSTTAERDTEYKWAAIEIAYDTTKYDTAYIFRSIRVEDQGALTTSASWYLDKVITLDDYLYGEQPGDGIQRAVYFYELEDKQLLVKEAYIDKTAFLEFMPPAGCLGVYESTMFFGNLLGWDEYPGPNVGEIRWSSTSDYQPELCPVTAFVTPETSTATVVAFEPSNGNMIGFGLDRVFHLRKESYYIRINELHQGFGIVGPFASTTIAGNAFYAAAEGIKRVAGDGTLEDVKALNYLVSQQWATTADHLQLAADPQLSALIVHNPEALDPRYSTGDTFPQYGHTAILWFKSNKLTELLDMDFPFVCEGWFHQDPNDLTTPLVKRALFVDGQKRVSLIDATRSHGMSFQDFTGTARLTISSKLSTKLYFAGGPSWTRVADLRLYNINPTSPNYGKSSRILASGSDGTGSFLSVEDPSLFLATDRVAISPVYCRWISANLPVIDEQTGYVDTEDFFSQRTVNGVGCCWTNVTGNAASTVDANYRATTWLGNSALPSASAAPLTMDDAAGTSILDKENPNWAAFGSTTDSPALQGRFGYRGSCIQVGLETFVSDLDFRLLAVNVSGTISKDKRSSRPS